MRREMGETTRGPNGTKKYGAERASRKISNVAHPDVKDRTEKK